MGPKSADGQLFMSSSHRQVFFCDMTLSIEPRPVISIRYFAQMLYTLHASKAASGVAEAAAIAHSSSMRLHVSSSHGEFPNRSSTCSSTATGAALTLDGQVSHISPHHSAADFKGPILANE